MPQSDQPPPAQTGTPHLARFLAERGPAPSGMDLSLLRIPAALSLVGGLIFFLIDRLSPNPAPISPLVFAIAFLLAGVLMMLVATLHGRRREQSGTSDAARAQRAVGTLYLSLSYGRGETDLPPGVLGWLEEAALQRERIHAASRHPRWEGRPEAAQAVQGADQTMERILALAEPTIRPIARPALGPRPAEPLPFVPPPLGSAPLPAGTEPIPSLVDTLRAVADELETNVTGQTETPAALTESLASLRARREAEAEIDQAHTA